MKNITFLAKVTQRNKMVREAANSYLVFYGTFSTNRSYHAIELGNVSHRVSGQHKYHAIKQ